METAPTPVTVSEQIDTTTPEGRADPGRPIQISIVEPVIKPKAPRAPRAPAKPKVAKGKIAAGVTPPVPVFAEEEEEEEEKVPLLIVTSVPIARKEPTTVHKLARPDVRRMPDYAKLRGSLDALHRRWKFK